MNGQVSLPFAPLRRRTLESFHHGANRELVELIENLIRSPAAKSLYVHGVAESGKTHLLQGAAILAQRLGRISAYIPLGETGVRSGLLSELGGSGVLCVDDLHRVVGSDEWERRLFDLYERSQQESGFLILSATEPPGALGVCLRDLRSRLAGQFVYRLSPLGEDQLAEALRREAKRRGMDISPATVEWLMRRVPRGARALFELLDRIDRLSLQENRRVTIPFLRDMGLS